jgi:hypothetical protein
LVLCGLILHELDTAGRTYLGFVVIFLIAFVARTISARRPPGDVEERDEVKPVRPAVETEAAREKKGDNGA